MSLYDKLMAVDDNTIRERRSREVHSARLSALFDIDTDITIEALPYRQVNKIMDAALKDNGRLDPDRAVDARCHLIRLSVKDIPFGDENLQKKFGASDPKNLAEKMFDYEIGVIADAILELSGYGETEEEREKQIEDEVKNS